MATNHTTSGNLNMHARFRRAFTLLEVVIAAGMLAMLLTTSVQMLRVLSVYQHGSERRAVALEAVQAVSDQIANIPWDQLTDESAKKVTIPKQLEGYLRGAKLSVSIEDEA